MNYKGYHKQNKKWLANKTKRDISRISFENQQSIRHLYYVLFVRLGTQSTCETLPQLQFLIQLQYFIYLQQYLVITSEYRVCTADKTTTFFSATLINGTIQQLSLIVNLM
ncbi:Hypothetical_protein [Hexamita inflata]|uniref:Hypothetical_protein n=1 Tax=Hexamita inflata TaxID=28002 RepID=A0AA86NP00_9EUKA|nr:Hypothetical protein HINF_LOCUS10748 [Hexamita inflata]CAI9923495.1 Hypothetical protein HINF_LOCUS11140 [Hexamita inflata]